MRKMEKEKVIDLFKDNFKQEFILVKAPGRINLIGEHTDYNEGFVMPGAINKAIWFALSPSGNDQYRFLAADYEEMFSIQSRDLHSGTGSWPDYLLGVVDQFRKKQLEIPGFNCVFGGNIPSGAGLSSSAALECGLAYGLKQMFELDISGYEMAKLCQRAENEFVGVQCGIMDQFASVFGKESQLFKLDCRSLEYNYIPFDPQQYSLVLIDTRVEHSLASSEYNKRRMECEKGVERLRHKHPWIKSLRDVTQDMLDEAGSIMDTNVYQKCQYVLNENQRLLQMENRLHEGDYEKCGELMFQTHDELRDRYEVSCKELDFLVDFAQESGKVAGARMMGGGFGGCTINLVRTKDMEGFINEILDVYSKKFAIKAENYTVRLSNGVELVDH